LHYCIPLKTIAAYLNPSSRVIAARLKKTLLMPLKAKIPPKTQKRAKVLIESFMKNQENRDLLKSVKQRKILRIYREYFGPDYIRLRDDIINSAITLFLKIALDFSQDIRELFL